MKEPMFIPVALGLLASDGRDIPLVSCYHDGKLENVANGDQPVFTTVLRVTKVSSMLHKLMKCPGISWVKGCFEIWPLLHAIYTVVFLLWWHRFRGLTFDDVLNFLEKS